MKYLRSVKGQYIVLAIIFAGIVLRIWNYANLFYFAIDEEKGAYITRGIATLSHLPTVGHPSSIGFRLGPLQYYLLAPFYAIAGAEPIVWGYVAVLVSIASMVLLYRIVARVNTVTASIALALYAFSYLNVLYDRRGWQVSFHSFLALALLYCVLMLAKGKKYFIFPLTGVLIAGAHFEVATILFIPLVIIMWKILAIKVPRQLILLSIGLFVLFQLPLLVFDLRHQFINSKYLINYFRPDASERIQRNAELSGQRRVYLAHNLIPYTYARLLYPSGSTNVAVQYANCPQYLGHKQDRVPLLVYLGIFALLVMYAVYARRLWRLKTDEAVMHKTISVYLGIVFTGIIVYTYLFHGEMAEYYLASTYAYFFIALASLLAYCLKGKYRWGLYGFVGIFIVLNGWKLFQSTNPYGYADKIRAVQFSLNTVGDAPFVLDSFQTCWYSGGYRYLYTMFGKEPLLSYMDQYMYEYYSPREDLPPQYRVVLLTPELVGVNPQGYDVFKNLAKRNLVAQGKFGAIEVYIQKL